MKLSLSPKKNPLSNTEFSAQLSVKVVSKDENKNFLCLPADFMISLPSYFFQIFDLIWEMYHYEEDLLGQSGVCVSWCTCTERLSSESMKHSSPILNCVTLLLE